MKKILLTASLVLYTTSALAGLWGSNSGVTDYENLDNKPTLGTSAALNYGSSIGQIPLIIDAGACSDTQYTTELTCETALETWTAVAALPFTINAVGLGDWPSAVSMTELGYVDGATSNLQDQIDAIVVGSPVTTAPTYSDDPCTAGQYAFSTTPPMYYCKATDTWDYQIVSDAALVWAGWSNPTPATYELILSIVDATGFDKMTIAGTDYTASATITGLSSATTGLTGVPDTGRAVACTGDVTGTTPNYSVDMSAANKAATCTFSASDTYADISFFWLAETLTLGEDDYSAGDTSATAESAVTLSDVTPLVGAHSINIPSASDFYVFDAASIIPTSGRIGQVVNFGDLSVSGLGIFRFANADQTSRMSLKTSEGGNIDFYWRDAGVSRTTCVTTTAPLSNGVTAFIEIAYDIDYREIFVNGVSVASCTTTTSAQTPTVFGIGNEPSSIPAAPFKIDNIIISSDKTRSLYPLAVLTASPR